MRAAVYHGPDLIRVEERPVPRVGPGELLVRVHGCGLCGSDVVKIQHRTVTPPVILGHEVVGTVVEVGPGAEGFGLGERVVVAHHVPCYVCHYCRRGATSMCRTFKALNLDPGGFAEYVRVPARNVQFATMKVPPGLGDREAALSEPLACCLRAIRRSRLHPGDTALVVGLGSIGLMMVQLGKLEGAVVIGSDPVAERRALAKRLGADLVLDPFGDDLSAAIGGVTEGRGADWAIVCGGSGRVVPPLLELVRDGGAINLFAPAYPDPVQSVDLNAVYHRELTITASYSSSPDSLHEALGLIASGRVQASELTSHDLPLEGLSEAVRLTVERRALKVYITIGEQP